MLKLEDFKKVKSSNKIYGGQKIKVILGLSNGTTAYYYDTGNTEYCGGDNNDDSRTVYP